jgi:hypothetical protein
MQDAIDYHLVKYQPDATWCYVGNSDESERYDIVCIRLASTYDSAIQALQAARAVATHVILIYPLVDCVNSAVCDFVKENDYLSYKIDGVVRIYLKNIM